MYYRIFTHYLRIVKMNTKHIKPVVDQNFNLHPLLRDRYSPRAFTNELVNKDIVELLIEAARWSPSSSNNQPWSFIIAEKGSSNFNLIVDSLMEGNKIWAKDAPWLIVALARDMKPDGTSYPIAWYDLGLAVANLTIQAESLGIGVHQMGGFSKSQIIEQFQISSDWTPITVSAIGYYGDAEQLEEPFKSRETATRTRKSLNEIIYNSNFS